MASEPERAYSHRDRRAHRAVERAFGIVAGACGMLIVLDVVARGPIVPPAAIAALGGVGIVYLAWAERTLREYLRDVRSVRDGVGSTGFVRAEVLSEVGPAREAGRPGGRSPHSRRRPADRGFVADEPSAQP